MSVSFFYVAHLNNQHSDVVLDEDASKHITQVLRMKAGDALSLTDGKGTKSQAVIINDNRKKCEVKVVTQENISTPKKKITIAISLLKNTARFEWFLEKATEIGVSEIIPLICTRTEKEKFRYDRMKSIIISAMLQSQQCWLPVLHPPTEFQKIVQQNQSNQINQKFIAHCLEANKQQLSQAYSPLTIHHSLILIGPEGDFTPDEIKTALEQHFQPVTLGTNRLRTETAGLVAATLLCAL